MFSLIRLNFLFKNLEFLILKLEFALSFCFEIKVTQLLLFFTIDDILTSKVDDVFYICDHS